MNIAIVNLGTIVSGDLLNPIVNGDALLLSDNRIAKIGKLHPGEIENADIVIDAHGGTIIPGLIDSHVHTTFGDYTPRQRTVGFLESYLHGGTTTAITASEVHVPGRPSNPEGVKALAVAAHHCFANYRPGGMKVIGGSLILEPGLKESDFQEVAARGVGLVKAGFGAFRSPLEYVPLINWSRKFGMISTVHTGGASIPGSSPITGDHLLAMNPDVSFHINGGPVAMPDADFVRVVRESKIALQLCTAGNLRTALLCAALARDHDALDRVLIATDTPTGSGVMPLGMLYMITYLSTLGGFAPQDAIAMATGNNARIYGLNSGILGVGRDADAVLLDAPLGGSKSSALDAIANGDIPAITAVITDGTVRIAGRSLNTPPPTRSIKVARRHASDVASLAHR